MKKAVVSRSAECQVLRTPSVANLVPRIPSDDLQASKLGLWTLMMQACIINYQEATHGEYITLCTIAFAYYYYS